MTLATLVTAFMFSAAPAGGVSIDVDAGFAGAYRLCSWTPVRVTVRNAAAHVKGKIVLEANPQGRPPTAAASRAFESPKNSTKTCTLYLLLNNDEVHVAAALLDGKGDTVAKAESDLGPSAEEAYEVFGAVGAIAFQPCPPASLGIEAKSMVTWAVDPAKLPDRWIGFDAFSALVFAGPYGQPGARQSAALATWLRGGGRAVVSVGSRRPEYARSLWPGLTGVSAFDRGAMDVGPALGGERLAWRTQVSALSGPGEALVEVDGSALVRRVPVGCGAVVLLGFDAAAKPFRDWPGAPAFWQRVLGVVPMGLSRRQVAMPTRETSLVLGDMVSHEGSGAFSFGWVVPLMIAYLVLIGPLDYFLAKRRWRRVTRFTFPAFVIVFSVLIYFGARMTKSAAMTYKHVTVLDAASGSDTARVTRWFSVYPPESKVYRVGVGPWPAVVGSVQGGAMELARRPETVFIGDSDARLDVALPQWSSELLRADAAAQLEPFTARLTLAGDSCKLAIGPARLPANLDDALLLYRDRMAHLRGVRAGRTFDVRFEPRRTGLESLFPTAYGLADAALRLPTSRRIVQATFLSLRWELERYYAPDRAPVFNARLELSRSLRDGAAYVIGAVGGNPLGIQVNVDGRPVAPDADDPGVTIVRYRVDVAAK